MIKPALKNIFQVLSTALVGLLLVILLIQQGIDIGLSIVIVMLVALIPLLFFKPYYSLLFLIVTRNLIDIFTERNIFSYASFDFNLASLFGLLIIPWAILIIIKEFSPKNRSENKKIHIPVLFPWLIFLFIAMGSLFYSMDVSKTFTDLIKLVDFFLLYLVSFLLIKNIKQVKTFLYWLVGSLIVPALVATYQIITGSGYYTEEIFNRAQGTFFHPNSLAFALVVAMGGIVILFLLNMKDKPRVLDNKQLILSLIFAFFGIVLLFTYTRGAWIGIVLLIVVTLLLNKKFIVIPLVAIVLLAMIYLPNIQASINKHFNIDISKNTIVERLEPESDESSGSLLWRQRIWRETFPAYYKKPFLGWGYGMFPGVRHPLVTFESDLKSLEAHNDYLRLSIEIGSLGLLSYLILYIFILKNVIKMWRSDKIYAGIYIGYIALTISLIIVSVADNLLRNAPVQWMYWSLTGVVMSIFYLKDKSKSV